MELRNGVAEAKVPNVTGPRRPSRPANNKISRAERAFAGTVVRMSLLRDRRLRLLVFGQAVNAIGSWCALVAIWGFASFHFDAGPGELAILGLAWALPPVLLGPLAGVPVDRLGPKRVLIVADGAAAGVALLFILAGSFEALVALAALDSVTKAFAEPAFQSLPPRLVDDDQLAGANALLATASQSAIAFGPLLAAGAIGAFGFQGAFVVDSLTYLVGIAVLLPFHIGPAMTRPTAEGETRRVTDDVREGFRVVAERAPVRRLLLLGLSVYLIWGAFIVVEPIYVREVLHGTPSTFALLQTSFGVGLLAAGAVITRLGDRAVRMWVVCLAAIGSGVAALVYVSTANEVVAFCGIVGWGVVTAGFIAPFRTLLQRAAPVETHGRIFAIDSTLHNLGDLISLPLVGLVAAGAGVQVAGSTMAAAPILGGAAMWWWSRRQRPSNEAEPDACPEPAAA